MPAPTPAQQQRLADVRALPMFRGWVVAPDDTPYTNYDGEYHGRHRHEALRPLVNRYDPPGTLYAVYQRVDRENVAIKVYPDGVMLLLLETRAVA